MATKKTTTAKAAEKNVAKKATTAKAVETKAFETNATEIEPKIETVAEVSAAPVKAPPSREAIAKRAFELFVARGGQHGDAFQDWVRAEHELTAH